jgi:hypothetical protein
LKADGATFQWATRLRVKIFQAKDAVTDLLNLPNDLQRTIPTLKGKGKFAITRMAEEEDASEQTAGTFWE